MTGVGKRTRPDYRDLLPLRGVPVRDPEPGAWPRMARIMAAQYDTKLKIEVVKVDALGDLKDPPPVAHLLGTAR